MVMSLKRAAFGPKSQHGWCCVVAIQVQKSSDSLSLTDHSLTVLYEGCTAMIRSTYKHRSYLHCRYRSCSFDFKNGYPFAATKVQILLKEVFARVRLVH